jgi:hypothetical protein
MRRALVAIAVVAGTGGGAAAQEGGPIRTGEHESFSRIVMTIEPSTEWSLELAAGEATVVFPRREIAFGTDDVWRRMPRTRVTAIEPQRRDGATAVRLALGCDCRVTASFVGARHLAIDVHDRNAGTADAVDAADASASATGAARASTAAVPDAAAAAAPVLSLEGAERDLREQVARAVEQGIVVARESHMRAEAAPAPAAPAEAPEPRAAAAPASAIDPAPTATPAPAPADEPEIQRPLARPAAAATIAAPARDHHPAASWDDVDAHAQIEAMTVFQRDRAGGEHQPAPHSACRRDGALDMARWTDGRPLPDQAVELRRLLVGEFDRPNGAVVRDLARLHIRYGMGAEAAEILRGFDVEVEDRDLLADLARVVESRAPDGPLARDIACPGRHGLWLAVAGQPAMIASERHFRSMRTALEEMPPALRALVGPTLVGRFLDAGREAQARVLHDVVVRPGVTPDADMRLASGRLAAAERRLPDAEAWLTGLVEANAPNAADAVLALVRARLDAGGGVPDAWVTDLRVLALEQRRGAREPVARLLIAEALARNLDLRGAFAELAALVEDLPGTAADVEAVAARLLAQADPEAVGRAAYAEAAIGHGGMMSDAPANDPTRVAVGARLLDLGLPRPALAVVGPAEARGSEPARLVAARARLALGEGAEALETLAGLGGEAAAALRARAHALTGAFDAAAAELGAAGRAAEAVPYAWAGGDWDQAASSPDPVQASMAAWMAALEGGGAAAAVSPLTQETAFRLAPPSLDRPSLAAARTLAEQGREVGGVLEALLVQMPDE